MSRLEHALVFGIFGSLVLIVGFLAWAVWADISNRHAFEGCAIDREHYARRTTFIATGKTVIPVIHPERWAIRLESRDGERHWHTVSKATYDAAGSGAFCAEPATKGEDA